MDPLNHTHIYMCAKLLNNTNSLVSFTSTSPASGVSVVATFPDGHVPNGLGMDHSTGLLYTATEGNWLPGTGVVYEVDPASGAVQVLRSGLWAADGLWIDQSTRRLYVTQLIQGNVWVYDLQNRVDLGFVHGGMPASFFPSRLLASSMLWCGGCRQLPFG